MQEWFSCPTPSFIGVEIQSRGIYLLQAEKKRHKWVLLNSLAARLPVDVVDYGKFEYSEKLSAYLSVYVDQWRMKGKAAAICLPSHSVRMQSLFLPQGLSEPEIRNEIEACAKRDLLGSSEDIYMDFCILPAHQAGYMEVYFAVAKKEQVDQYVECVEAAGLKVKVVEVDLYAMKRAINFCMPALSQVEGQGIAFFCIREQRILFAVFLGDKLICSYAWEQDLSEHIGSLLKERISVFLTTFQDILIHRAVVCASPVIQTRLKETKYWIDWPVAYLHPLEHLTFHSQAEASQFSLQAADFLTVLGLVLRDRPAWL